MGETENKQGVSGRVADVWMMFPSYDWHETGSAEWGRFTLFSSRLYSVPTPSAFPSSFDITDPHLNKSILIQLYICVNETLRLPLHTFRVTSCFLQALPLALSIHSCVSPIRVNTSLTQLISGCVAACVEGRLRIISGAQVRVWKGLLVSLDKGLSSRVWYLQGHPKLT